MQTQSTRRAQARRLFQTAFAVAVTLGSAGFTASPVRAQAAATSKNAEDVYKNIVQLKGTPADQLMPAMQFMASSLGVECAFCHVAGKMEADDKGAKKTTREMIAMQAAINKGSFRGQLQVTCFSCHRGSARPVNTPPVLEGDAPARPATPLAPPAPGAAAVTADQIVEKYVTSLGGADAIKKVASRVMKGTVMTGGSETPIELFTKAPNKRVSIGNGQSFTAFDGTAGWMGNTGRPARDMSATEAEAAGLDAEFSLALRLKEIFPQLRRGRPETIGGVECETLNGTRPGRPPVRLYFDKTSGLLLRMVRYAETPVGRNATQIDYADYRELDGVKSPFRWTLSRPNGRFTIQVKEAKNNVAIDDARFAKPEGEVK
jgi:photosynthetic reaction center cytochrome c subunit